MFRKLQLKFAMIFFAVLYSQWSYSQLPSFTLTATATNETCTGNASLSFNVSATAPGATIIYSVYLLPNVTTPIAVLSGNILNGLASGSYRVIALQSLGSESNTQQQDLTINNLISPLIFSVSGSPETCGDGTITVNTTQGTPVTFETISGPIIIPPQASNVFTGLAAGEYDVRVTDACGDAVVQTYTIVPSNYLNIGAISTTCQLMDCNTISSSFIISAIPGASITYPITVIFTFFQTGMPPVFVSQTFTSSGGPFLTVPIDMPYVPGQPYSYSIDVTDACGHVFTQNGIGTMEGLTVGLTSQTPPGAPNQINVSPCNYVPPYNINFTSFPAGFNPADYNSEYPGPYTTIPITFDSVPGNEIPDGTYEIEITDSCGSTGSGEITLGGCPIDIKVLPLCSGGFVMIPGELGVDVVSVILTGASPAYSAPLPHDVSFNIANGHFGMFFPNGTYTFNVTTVCGDIVVLTATIITSEPTVTAIGGNSPGCAPYSGFINVSLEGAGIGSIVITQAPTAFLHPLPYDASASISPTGATAAIVGQLPVGDYVLVITDICGFVFPPINVNVPLLVSDVRPNISVLAGCEEGFASIFLTSMNGRFQQVIITAAPAAYPNPLPHNVPLIATDGAFYMNSLPEGAYSFHTVDVCGIEHNFSGTIVGYHINQSTVTVQPNCGSFNLLVEHNIGVQAYYQEFWLQRLNPVTNQWGHPITGIPYISGVPTNTNSYGLLNAAVNYNIAALGDFRVLRTNKIYSNGNAAFTDCIATIDEFEFNGDLKLTAAYIFPCSSGSSEVHIIAVGAPPLTYTITTKDGLPFFVDNGNSNVFSGLPSGIYNFQVQDECGNIVNRLFDITTLSEPVIIAGNLCDGQVGQLSVAPFSFLNYEWWKGTNTNTILSTTNTLTFNPFSNATSPGTYYVRIYSPTGLFCIDRIISYDVPAISNPNAGGDAIIGICGNTNSVNLSDLLGTPFDSNGAWEEISNSGMLSGNVWLPIGIPFGVYTFKYTVNGLCGDNDEAVVTINFIDALPVPVITVDTTACEGSSFQLNVDDIPGAAFQWTGPNNFSSDEQNPIIPNVMGNSGSYTVAATLNACVSAQAVNIVVNPVDIVTISASCIHGSFSLSANLGAGTNIPDTSTFSWTGPQNFSSSMNPVSIAGLTPGSYSLTVTTPDGCTYSQSVAVATTQCATPNGISPNGDGSNDSFDLSGFDVLKLEIFSRYGRLVYEQDNYVNQWHGQDFRDRILPDATYYYYIRLRSGEERTGWVYVTR